MIDEFKQTNGNDKFPSGYTVVLDVIVVAFGALIAVVTVIGVAGFKVIGLDVVEEFEADVELLPGMVVFDGVGILVVVTGIGVVV